MCLQPFVKKQHFFPNIDCFANKLNAELDSYVSFKPDTYATAIDAFSLNWSFYKCYVFPPFSVVHKVLQKIRVDKAMVLCVFPEWPTQPW